MDNRSLLATVVALPFIYLANTGDASAEPEAASPAPAPSDSSLSSPPLVQPSEQPASTNPEPLRPQAQAPSPPSSAGSAASPVENRNPTLAEQFADIQRSVRQLEEERARRLKEEAPSWAVHVNPLNLLLNEIVVGVDYAVLDRLQVTAQASYYDNRVVATDNTGVAAGAGVRLYPTSYGYRGWYISPTISFRAGTAENAVTGETGDLRALLATVMTGHQWIWAPVMLRAGLGVARVWDAGSEVNGQLNTELNGWGLALDGALGLVF